jgi:hypothetical protein
VCRATKFQRRGDSHLLRGVPISGRKDSLRGWRQWLDWNLDVFGESGNLATEVEWSEFVVFISELVRQKSSTWPKKIDRIRNSGLDGNDFDFQNISRFCTLNPDGARQNVRNGTPILHFAIDLKESRLNLVTPQTSRFKSIYGESDQGFNFNHVS